MFFKFRNFFSQNMQSHHETLFHVQLCSSATLHGLLCLVQWVLSFLDHIVYVMLLCFSSFYSLHLACYLPSLLFFSFKVEFNYPIRKSSLLPPAFHNHSLPIGPSVFLYTFLYPHCFSTSCVSFTPWVKRLWAAFIHYIRCIISPS